MELLKTKIMTDNFKLIKPLIKFDNENQFYFVQILQRSKENPDLGSNNRMIKAYYIYSIEQLEKYKEEIIKLCTAFNARAYIHLNRRDSGDVALELLEYTARCIRNKQFYTLSKSYNSVCGSHNSKIDKSWVVDVDYPKDERNDNPLRYDKRFVHGKYIQDLYAFIYNLQPIGHKILAEIPTKNGIHLITKAFNMEEFRNKYPEIEVQKNNPTILYSI